MVTSYFILPLRTNIEEINYFGICDLFFCFQVYIVISSLNAHFSSSIYVAILGLIAHLDVSSSKSEEMIISTLGSLNVMPNGPRTLNTLRFSIGTNLQAAKINVNLENDAENSSIFTLSLREFAIRYNVLTFFFF